LSLTALRLVEPLAHLRKRPSMLAPDTIVGWSLRQAVDNEDIWRGLGIERLYPSVYLGIPATLDSAIPYRWLHPLADHG
jgi:hypothetical protein